MKIIVTAKGNEQDAEVDPRFGRCAYFALLDMETGDFDAVPNPFVDATGGAGTQAAQWVIEQGAEVLLTGRCGPKAATVLQDAGIRVIEGVSGNVQEALERYLGEAQNGSAAPSGRGLRRGPGGGRGTGGKGMGLGRGGRGPGRRG